MSSYDVRFWEIRTRKGRRLPHEVRWSVAGKGKSKSFATKALAESFRAELMTAARQGQAFDIDAGLPEPMVRARQSVSWYELARDYLAMKWPRAAAKSRASIVETLATVTPVLVRSDRGMPDAAVLRKALRDWAFDPARDGEPPGEVASALRWVERSSVPVGDVEKPEVIRRALDACARKLDGTPAGAATVSRKRRVLYNVLRYALKERKLLTTHPIDDVDWKAPEAAEEVDRRVVANTAQVRELLAALSYVGGYGRARGRRLVAFFACLYFAVLRPAEAAGLRECDCELPEGGWGRLLVTHTRPSAGKRWTGTGEVHERRGLKHRPVKSVRVVPIPPELVHILRAHIDTFGVGAEGRLFRSERGNVLSSSAYWRAWQEARELALTPAQVASPLARRPYDLRHAGVSLWLNAGVPATEVAQRAGHSVEVLLKVYAKCIDGQEETINKRIEAALSSPDHDEDDKDGEEDGKGDEDGTEDDEAT